MNDFFWEYLIEIKRMKKFHIFDQNHELTP